MPDGSMVGSQPSLSAYHALAFERSFVARLGWIGASVITDGLVAVAWLMAASGGGGSIAVSRDSAPRVGVEAASGLLPEVARGDEVDEDLRRRVVLLADAVVQD